MRGKEEKNLRTMYVCEVLYNLCETRNLIFFGSSLFLQKATAAVATIPAATVMAKAPESVVILKVCAAAAPALLSSLV